MVVAAFDRFQRAQSLRVRVPGDMGEQLPADAMMLVIFADRDRHLSVIEAFVAGEHAGRDHHRTIGGEDQKILAEQMVGMREHRDLAG
jgi:hypothetical protein